MRFGIFFCLIIPLWAQNAEPDKYPHINYIPLENKKEDIALLKSYWPMNENAFIADLDQLDACKWGILLCEAKPDKAMVPTANPEDENATAIGAGGVGILDNTEVLKEIMDLRDYIENELKVPLKDSNEPLRYANVCMSYVSPVTNKSVCRYPEVDLVKMLSAPERQKVWKSYKSPMLYPYFGDKGAPLGVKMITGPLLGGVELDKVTGQVRQVKSIVLKYFLRSQGWSIDWRNALRDYIMNKYASTVIDVRYIDDEVMKLRLVDKNSNAQLAAHLLDPTPTATTSGFWPDGLTAQLVFSQVPDLSRDIELNRALKTLTTFENTPYTFGEDGTVCWIRTFNSWKKWLVQHMYSGLSVDEEPENPNMEDQTLQAMPVSPFGNFQEDLRVFLKNPNYPVYSQHVVTETDHDGKLKVKAFRCLITLRNLTDQTQRTQAIQYLRDLASKAQHNITVVTMDFFPPVPQSSSRSIQNFLVPFGFAVMILLKNLISDRC